MEVYINPDDIEQHIKDFANVNRNFVFSNYIKSSNKEEYLCNFFIDGKPCKIRFYIKARKLSVNMMPIGKNIEEANTLIEYLGTVGFPINSTPPKQTVFPCESTVIRKLIDYIESEFPSEIEIKYYNNNRVRLIGYNKDHIDITYYPQSNVAMLQGRPFRTYGIVMTLLSQISEVTFESIVEMSNMFTTTKKTSEEIRTEIKQRLSNSYSYLDEALIKSLSGSISSLNAIKESEDYTCCVTGAFKTLEGYLTKVLSQKYKYKIKRTNKFSMFYRSDGKPSEIDKDGSITSREKSKLVLLNQIYSNKRNVFLHSSIDPSQTRIIENWQEAKDIVDEITKNIEDSYNVFYN